MQKRHTDRQQYFNELAHTSEKYFIPYIKKFIDIDHPVSILEIGCGDGGNLLPFSRLGHEVVGIDIAESRIKGAVASFEKEKAKGEFICANILEFDRYKEHFDLIICHDVIEHIGNKQEMIARMENFMKPSGVLFIAFPAWQMPFGGHQQICSNRWLSKLPFMHLLPKLLYKGLLSLGGEKDDCVNELMSIKETKITIEQFEKLISKTSLEIVDRCLYFINPHYEIKFGLKPRRLSGFFSGLPYLRNFMSTSCFYVLKRRI